MLVSTAELGKIMRELNGPSYRHIYGIAERYVKKRLPAQYEATNKTLRPLQVSIASLFIQAMQDFMSRDSKSEAAVYEKDAKALQRTAQIVTGDDGLLEIVESKKVQIGMMKLRPSSAFSSYMGTHASACGEQAILALMNMAESYLFYADALRRDDKKITFFYCLGRRFQLARLPDEKMLPTPKQANNAFTILMNVLRGTSSRQYKKIRKTKYSITDGKGKEITDLMRNGFEAGCSQMTVGNKKRGVITP